MSVGRSRRLWFEAAVAFLMAAALVVAAPGSVPHARAASILVCPSGDPDEACDYFTLADAVSAANDLDDITLKAGTYVESTTTQWVEKNLTVTGAGSGVTIIDGTGLAFRVMNIFGDMTVDISALTIAGGDAGASRGGSMALAPNFINSPVAPVVTLTDVEITGASSNSDGGGIENNGATLTIDSSDILNNTAGGDGGGIYNYNSASLVLIDSTVDGNAASGSGGGIYHAVDAGAFSISGSAITNNASNFQGGGIWTDGGAGQIHNSTIGANTTNGGGVGGGILVGSNASAVEINNVTVSENFGSQGGGIWTEITGSPVTMANSIFFGNTAIVPASANCSDSGGIGVVNVDGPVILGVNNCTTALGAAGSISATDPGLSALALNGGDRLNYQPASPGPAVDAGNPAAPGGPYPACLANDQNGAIRPAGAACDVGSIELFAASLQNLIDTNIDGTVEVPPGTYNETITIGGGKTLVGLGASLNDVIIDGNGAGPTVTVLGGDVTFENLTITGGSSPNQGGGIAIDGGGHTVTLNTVELIANVAALDGGGMWIDSNNTVVINDSFFVVNDAGGGGGAIFLNSSSTLEINDTVFQGNTAVGNGGGVLTGGEVTINGGLFESNDAASGAAIFQNFAASVLTINTPTSCTVAPDVGSFVPLTTFSGNDATDRGGAIVNNAQATIYSTLFEDNSALNGGALYEESGAGELLVGCSAFDSNSVVGDGGAVGANDDGSIVVEDTLFFANLADGAGGAIGHEFDGTTTEVRRSIFDSNEASSGGAISAQDDLSIEDSALIDNTADGFGGAIEWSAGSADVALISRTTVDANQAERGGGLHMSGSGDYEVVDSTISNNVATDNTLAAGGVYSGTFGTFENSTISGNSAPAGSTGGLFSGTTVELNYVTVTDNSDFSLGGGVRTGESLIRMANSILAGNTSTNGRPDCSASIISGGHNIVGIDDFDCADPWLASDRVGDSDPIDGVGPVDPGIDVLADNGGPTLTHALLPTSPAVDAAGTVPVSNFFNQNIQFNGSAFLTGNGTVKLTDDPVFSETGSAFDDEPISPLEDFQVDFTFQITNPVGNFPPELSGDGLTFAMVNDPTTLGLFGAGIAIGGVTNSVAVEFDTFNNTEPGGGNHIGIDIAGVTLPSAIEAPVPGIFEDETPWEAIVTYRAATNTLTASVGKPGLTPTVIETTVDLAAIVDPTDIYIGFTASTAGNLGDHEILTSVLGTPCPTTDQRGAPRPVATGCDVGSVELQAVPAQPTEVTVNIVNDGGVIPPNPPIIPIDDDSGDLFFNVINGPAAAQLGAIQLGAIQLGAIQLGAIQLGAIGAQDAIAYLDMSTLIAASGELRAAQLGAIGPLDTITLVDIPIPGGWEQYLDLTGSALNGREPFTVTLAQALADPVVGPAIEPLHLFESGITASQLGAIPLEVYALGALQLGAIQLGAIQLGAINADICDLVEDCSIYGIDPSNPGSQASIDAIEGFSLMSVALLGADLSDIQLGAIQLGAIDLTDVQLGAIQLGAIDLAASQLGAIQLGAIQLGAIQLGAIQLGAINGLVDPTHPDAALVDPDADGVVNEADLTVYWCSAGGLDCGPLPKDEATGASDLSGYSILALGAMGADLDVIQLGAIQLGAIDLAKTQLGAIQLGAIDLTGTQLGAIQLGAIQLGAIQLGAIQLGAIDPAVSQLGAIELGEINLVGTQLGAIQLGAIQLGAIQLGAVDLIFTCSALEGGCEAHPDLTLEDAAALGVLNMTAPLAALEGAFGVLTMDDLAAAGVDIFTAIGTATISDLYPETTIADLPPDLTLFDIQELVGAMTIFDLLLALLDPSDLAWEDLNPADLAEQNPSVLENLSTGFTVNADPLFEPGASLPFTAVITLEVPEGMFFDGNAGLFENPNTFPPNPESQVPLGESTVEGNTYQWVVDDVLANTFYYMSYGVSTFITVDDGAGLRATVTALGVTGEAGYAATLVELEPNDTFADAILLGDDVIALGFIDSETDIDLYQLDVPDGAQVQAFLNGGGADLDLVLFEPGTGILDPLRGAPEQVVDGSLDPIIGYTDETDPEAVADIPNTNVAPVYKASVHRGDEGEQVVTPPLATGGTYFAQVTGFNGAVNTDTPYSLRIKVVSQPDRGACNPRVFPHAGAAITPSVLPAPGSLPSGVETLFIVNEQRYAESYGAAELGALQSSIANLLTSQLGPPAYDAPIGAVIPIDQAPGIAGLYGDLDNDRCNPDTSNALVAAIADVVDSYRDAHPTITSIVLVGGDDLIPHARVRDNTTIANEREYVNEFAGNNELVGALAAGMVLTDDAYADANPLFVIQGAREVFVPQFSVGRLVETPLEIEAVLAQFVASGGFLNIATQQTATVFGYDFLSDMADAMVNELNDDFAPNVLPPEDIIIGDDWTGSQWAAAMARQSAVISTNAHYDHDEGLPGLSNSGASAELFGLNDLPASLAGSVVYSVGCHSGFNAPGAYLDPADASADWVQALLERQAVYVANTGFGYGDDTFIGYSEALMLEFTKNFSETNTIGEALTLAKQQRALDTFAWSPYDDKALMESTLFGLPFYKTKLTPVPPPPPPADTSTSPDPVTGQQSAPVASGVTLPAPSSTPEGDYIATDTLIQVPFRPIEPAERIDITSDTGLVARGAIITSLTSTDVSPFDAVYARAILFDADAEPEVETAGPFPTVLHQIRSGTTLAGDRDFLILARGRYFPATATQRLYDSIGAVVYYADAPVDDVTGPEIPLTEAIELNGNITFSVTAVDPESDVDRVAVLYKASGSDGAWLFTDLELVAGEWTATVPGLGDEVEFWVQVLNGSGLVSVSSDKGALHIVEQPGPPGVVVSDPGANGWIVGPAVATATPPDNAPSVELEYSIDGAPFAPYEGAIVLPEGDSTITVRPVGIEESATVVEAMTDTNAPTVTITTPADQVVAQGASLPLTYTCDDATSGVSSCAGPVSNGVPVDTSAVGEFTVTVQGVDLAGNKATARVSYTVVEHPADPATIDVVDAVVAVQTAVTANGTYAGADAHIVRWEWGDGTVCEDGVVFGAPQYTTTTCGDGPGTSTSSHSYAETGVYVVSLTVEHGAGLIETATTFAVVYDPSAGFVTGGGWIDSPPGAFTPDDPSDPDVVGVAEFGFVSKYRKGRTVPTGNTAFEFEAGQLDFSSTSYDWLVVQGDAKASFRGTGVVAGSPGEVKFRVTLRDADGNDNDGFVEDAFRIKIWTELPGGQELVLYDSGLGEDPDSTFGGTTELGGGSIMIHGPKKKRK